MRNLFTGLRTTTTNQIRNTEHNVQTEEKQVLKNNRDQVRSVMDIAYKRYNKVKPENVIQKKINEDVPIIYNDDDTLTEDVMRVNPNDMGKVNYLRPVTDPYNPKIKKKSVVDLKSRQAAKKPLPKIKPSNKLYKEMRKKVRVYNYRVGGDMVARKTENQPITSFDTATLE